MQHVHAGMVFDRLHSGALQTSAAVVDDESAPSTLSDILRDEEGNGGDEISQGFMAL